MIEFKIDAKSNTQNTVLPFKIGDAVFAHSHECGGQAKYIICGISINQYGVSIDAQRGEAGSRERIHFEAEDIGKTVFLVKKLDRWFYGLDMASGEDRTGWI